ncbi:(2Fe-2S)-binding protein [Aeromicrobium sp. CF3.5]|uniref:(2Fe-2S)-binding protein n=1 Tax=Aeromicrobium sp. CF3.5 TaxID=3373078 RepID=UPI003EE635D8
MTISESSVEPTHSVRLRINGVSHHIDVPPRRLLSDALRHDVGLTGTHVGCEHGVCGACTILIDGEPMRSCLMFAVSAADYEITTVEGLTRPDGSLGPVQQAFKECHGLQCGFCTPGFLTTITAGLRDNPDPTVDEAREMIGGNLCRCTGYQNIVSAVSRAAEITRGDAGSSGSASASQADTDSSSDVEEALDALGASDAMVEAVEQDTSIDGEHS